MYVKELVVYYYRGCALECLKVVTHFRIKFSGAQRMMCLAGQEVDTVSTIILEATTFAETNMSMQIYAEVLHNFTVRFAPLLLLLLFLLLLFLLLLLLL